MQRLPKILLVEADRNIAVTLTQALSNSYVVEVAATGQIALFKVDSSHYDIIVLDLDLADMTGVMVCQQLRDKGLDTPILILSAINNVLNKIKLLDAGANDYLTKPFSLGELKARLRVLTRASHPAPKPIAELSASGIVLDRRNYNVTRDGLAVKLRRKEFALLECLLQQAGSVVTRRALTRYAWQGTEDLWTNTVDVHIKHLRDKIDKPFGRPLIRTIHGVGYRLDLQQEGQTSPVATS